MTRRTHVLGTLFLSLSAIFIVVKTTEPPLAYIPPGQFLEQIGVEVPAEPVPPVEIPVPPLPPPQAEPEPQISAPGDAASVPPEELHEASALEYYGSYLRRQEVFLVAVIALAGFVLWITRLLNGTRQAVTPLLQPKQGIRWGRFK